LDDFYKNLYICGVRKLNSKCHLAATKTIYQSCNNNYISTSPDNEPVLIS